MDLTEPPVTPRPADYFLASGLYDYDGGRIRLKPMSNQNRWFIIHRKRMSEFLTSLWRLRPHMIAREIPEGLAPEMDTSQVAEQLKALDGILQILKGTGAKVEAVVTPNAKWLETPGRIQVRNQMIALCQKEGIQVQDLSKALADRDFLDQDHMTFEGQQITNQKLLPFMRPFL